MRLPVSDVCGVAGVPAIRYNAPMPKADKPAALRSLPSVSRLLEEPAVVNALSRLPRAVVVDALRAVIADARSDQNGAPTPPVSAFVEKALQRAEQAQRPSLRRAVNATGVVLHTGLGRAVLSQAARDAVMDVASGHSTVEIDAESGKRGSRQDHVAALLCELTGAEAAIVVNNNAGATFLSVTALAASREVIISRGELVEIGGSFRMPDIIAASGARMVEVGTTNRTRLSDFERAITVNTGLLLRCHPSNFKVVGFTEEVPAAELARLGRERGIPVMDDLGSGALVDTSLLGTGPTTTLRAAVESGCDVVTASGDKLLGGPQAGIIVGKAEYVKRIAKHPLARALRIDKLTLAALEATLRLYRDPERARQEIPTLRYLSRGIDELRQMAGELLGAIRSNGVGEGVADLVEEHSQVGGGSLPGENLPTACVRIQPPAGVSVDEFAARLRAGDSPVFARIKEGSLVLDLRTLEREEFGTIARAVGRSASTLMGRD
jgi:L-seryl-tRNA(Ser) seleniumtransferase